jgi:hypothetical protein
MLRPPAPALAPGPTTSVVPPGGSSDVPPSGADADADGATVCELEDELPGVSVSGLEVAEGEVGRDGEVVG